MALPDHPVAEALRKSFLEDGPSVDVVLCSEVDGQRVPATRFVLSLLSGFFKELLQNKDLLGGEPHEIHVPVVEGPTLTNMVEYCHTGDSEAFRLATGRTSADGAQTVSIAAASVVKLAMAGDYLDMPSLTNACVPCDCLGRLPTHCLFRCRP